MIRSDLRSIRPAGDPSALDLGASLWRHVREAALANSSAKPPTAGWPSDGYLVTSGALRHLNVNLGILAQWRGNFVEAHERFSAALKLRSSVPGARAAELQRRGAALAATGNEDVIDFALGTRAFP